MTQEGQVLFMRGVGGKKGNGKMMQIYHTIKILKITIKTKK